MPIVEKREDVADLMGVSVRSVAEWKNEPGFPLREDGKYDTEAIEAWHKATKRRRDERTDGVSAEVALRTRATKLQILELKRQHDELELERKRGEVVPRGLMVDVLAIWANGIRGLTGTLQRNGNTEAAQLIVDSLDRIKKQIHDRIDHAIREAQK